MKEGTPQPEKYTPEERIKLGGERGREIISAKRAGELEKDSSGRYEASSEYIEEARQEMEGDLGARKDRLSRSERITLDKLGKIIRNTDEEKRYQELLTKQAPPAPKGPDRGPDRKEPKAEEKEEKKNLFARIGDSAKNFFNKVFRRGGKETKEEGREASPEELFIYRLRSGDSGAERVPDDFKLTPEMQKITADLVAAREDVLAKFKDEYAESRKMRKSGYEKNKAQYDEAVIWRENAEKEYEKKLELLKRELLNDFLKRKKAEYPSLTDKELAQEGIKFSSTALLESVTTVDMELEMDKMRLQREAGDKGFVRYWFERYAQAPRAVRWAIAAGLAAGIGGLTAGAGAGFMLGAAYAGQRSLRGMLIGGGLYSIYDKGRIQKKYAGLRKGAKEKHSQATLQALEAEVNDGIEWLSNEEKKLEMMKHVDDEAVKYRKELQGIAGQEAKSRRKAALVTGLIGGLTSMSIDYYRLSQEAGVAAGATGAREVAVVGGGAAAGAEVVGAGTEVASNATEVVASADYSVMVEQGDSVWNLLEEQARTNVEGFSQMNEVQQTYVLDALKDEIAGNPALVGFESGANIDLIQPGQELDFSQIFENNALVSDSLSNAQNLSQTAMDNITQNNAVLDQWVVAHPGELLTSEKVEEILRGTTSAASEGAQKATEAGVGSVPEAEGAVVPETVPYTPRPFGIVENTHPLFGTVQEAGVLERYGFTPSEYQAIAKVPTNQFLAAFPAEGTAELPYMYSNFSEEQLGKFARLAHFVQDFRPGTEIQKVKLRTFLQMVGPRSV